MGIAIFAPSYNLVHGCSLETVRRLVACSLSTAKRSSSSVNLGNVFDQSFWSKPSCTRLVVQRLCRFDIDGIIILIRHGDRPMQMRRQIDLIIQSLFFAPKQKLPALPICILFHGNESVSSSEKRRIKVMFKAYLSNQDFIPKVMFTEHLIQTRHTYSRCLREDKIAAVVGWIADRSRERKAWSEYQEDQFTEIPSTARSSRDSFMSRQAVRRSLSLPRVIPPDSPEFLSQACAAALFTINLSIDGSLLKSALRQVTNGERHWDYTCWTYERADYLHTVFSSLITQRDRMYTDLQQRSQTLRADEAVGRSSRSRRQVFLTHFSWLVQMWNRRVTHATMRCQIGNAGTVQIVRFAEPLTMEELKVVRAWILDHFVVVKRRESRKTKLSSVHRSLSLHEIPRALLTSSSPAKSLDPFRINHSLQTVFSQEDTVGLRVTDLEAEASMVFPIQDL